jgi:adenylate cyclase
MAHQAVAVANLWLGNFQEAEKAARRAIDLSPNYAGAHTGLGQVLDLTGRHEAAIASLDESVRLDPLYHMALQFRGRAYFALGRYDEAAADFERRIAMSPNTDLSRAFLASVHGHAGRNADAQRLWAELAEVNPGFSIDRLRRVLPGSYSEVIDRFVEGLRKAGIEA